METIVLSLGVKNKKKSMAKLVVIIPSSVGAQNLKKRDCLRAYISQRGSRPTCGRFSVGCPQGLRSKFWGSLPLLLFLCGSLPSLGAFSDRGFLGFDEECG